MERMFSSFIEFLRRSKKTVLLIIVVAAITIVLSTMISIWLSTFDNYLVPSLGTIRTTGVEAYGGNITDNAKGEQHIDWGTIYPGTSTNRSFYIKSQSSIQIILKLETSNWMFNDSKNNIVEGPSNSTPYMNLMLNYNETIIRRGKTVEATLTLYVNDSFDFIEFLVTDDVQKFSFDIHIYAEG